MKNNVGHTSSIILNSGSFLRYKPLLPGKYLLYFYLELLLFSDYKTGCSSDFVWPSGRGTELRAWGSDRQAWFGWGWSEWLEEETESERSDWIRISYDSSTHIWRPTGGILFAWGGVAASRGCGRRKSEWFKWPCENRIGTKQRRKGESILINHQTFIVYFTYFSFRFMVYRILSVIPSTSYWAVSCCWQ